MKRLIVCTAMAFVLLGASSAQATTVRLGSPLTGNFNQGSFGSVSTVAQTTLPGATLVSPFNGTIVSWQVIFAQGGPYRLKVVRPAGAGLFTAVATTTSGPITGTGILTFQANLPIRAGDRVGIEPNAAADTLGVTPNMTPPGAVYDVFTPALGGTPQAPTTQPRELGFNATVVSNCVVPSVLGLDLATATAAIEADAANCDIGAVTKPKKKKRARKQAKGKKPKLIVRSQSPAAGTEGPAGTDVALTLGNKKRKRKKK